jgi:hypothetical protein
MSADNIGVSFEDEGTSSSHPGKKKGKKKKKKAGGKKGGDSHDMYQEYPESGNPSLHGASAFDDEGNVV